MSGTYFASLFVFFHLSHVGISNVLLSSLPSPLFNSAPHIPVLPHWLTAYKQECCHPRGPHTHLLWVYANVCIWMSTYYIFNIPIALHVVVVGTYNLFVKIQKAGAHLWEYCKGPIKNIVKTWQTPKTFILDSGPQIFPDWKLFLNTKSVFLLTSSRIF